MTPKPWESSILEENEEQLPSSEVTFSAIVELSCDKILAPHIRTSLNWFTANGELTDPVESPACQDWEQLGAADGGTTASDGSDSALFQARFTKSSPAVKATCQFVRRLPGMVMRAQLRLPESLEEVRASLASADAQKEAVPAAAPAKGKKGAAPETVQPSFPERTLDFEIDMTALVLLGRCGGPPRIVKDFTATVKTAEGLISLRIGVECNVPVLSPELVEYLNPLLITLNGVHRLPHEEHIGQKREQVFAVLDGFGQRRKTNERALNEQGSASFDMHSVFWTGTWNQRYLREFLQTESLTLELHDRDISLPEPKDKQEVETAPEAAAKAKAKAAGKPPSRPATGASAPGPVGEEEGADTTRPARKEKPPKIAPSGVTKLPLSQLLGPFMKTLRHTRSNIAPALGPGNRKHIGQGTIQVPMLFGPGSKELLANQEALSFEFVPRYLENGSYINCTFGIAGPIKPRANQPVEEKIKEEEPRAVSPKGKAKGKARGKAKGKAAPKEEPKKEETAPELGSDGKPAIPKFEVFGRLVLVTAYRQSTMMKRLLALVREQNANALDLDEGQSRTIAAIQLTDKQRRDRKLDILTGFCVMDKAMRVTVVEGLREGAMTKVTEVLGAGCEAASNKCKILFHPDVGFGERLYSDFNLTIKQIKLRAGRLERLMQRPDLYDRGADDKEVFETLQSLMEIKRAQRLHHLKALNAFPASQGIFTIETLYGDFVADEELAGGNMDNKSSKSGGSTAKSGTSRKQTLPAAAVEEEQENQSDSDIEDIEDVGHHRTSMRITMKAPTNAKNLAFNSIMKQRAEDGPPDMRERHKTTIREKSLENAAARPKKKPDESFLEGERVHIYSSQTYNSVELQKKALRNKLEEKHHSEFGVYNQEFMSGCFPMIEKDIDPMKLLREEVFFDDGREPFRWPRPRDKTDYRKPSRDVSGSRQEELSYPWQENELNPGMENKEIVKGAFDQKTLGTGGASVIATRRPGLQEPYDPPPPPEVKPVVPMRYNTGFASMGMPTQLEKFTKTILQGAPQCKGLDFSTRSTPRAVTQKFGKGTGVSNVGCAPVSYNKDEDFQEPDKGNSEYPHQFSAMIARPVVPRKNPLDRTVAFKAPMISGPATTQSWAKSMTKPLVNLRGSDDLKKAVLKNAVGGADPFKKTAPLSARGPKKQNTAVDQAIPMSAR